MKRRSSSVSVMAVVVAVLVLAGALPALAGGPAPAEMLPTAPAPATSKPASSPGSRSQVTGTQAPKRGSPHSKAPTQSPGGETSPAEKAAPAPHEEEAPDGDDDWGEGPEPPDNFIPDWNAMEVTPGGFVVERGVLSAHVPQPGGAFPSAPTPTPGDEASTDGATGPISGAIIPGKVEQAGSRESGLAEPIPGSPAWEGESSSTEAVTTLLEAAPPGDAEASPEEVAEEVAEPPDEEPFAPSPAEELAPLETGVTVSGSLSSQVVESLVSPPPSVVEMPIVAPEVAQPAPPYILPPAGAYAGEDLRMITVVLRTGADRLRDNLRLRQCYGILISYSGHDRFALQIFERSRGYRIEFPNYTTLYSAELVARLGSIVGADNVIVEPLRLH